MELERRPGLEAVLTGNDVEGIGELGRRGDVAVQRSVLGADLGREASRSSVRAWFLRCSRLGCAGSSRIGMTHSFFKARDPLRRARREWVVAIPEMQRWDNPFPRTGCTLGVQN